MTINENIKTICKARGLSFAELAARLDMTRQNLHAITTGRPTLATLERIAAALSVPVYILLHPDPAAVLAETATPGRPVLSCPWCRRPIFLEAAPAGLIQDPGPGPARTTTPGGDQTDSKGPDDNGGQVQEGDAATAE